LTASMLHTTRRRRRAVAGRWSAWARALAGGHARTLRPRRDRAMTLITPRLRGTARANTHISLAVHPHIHLAARRAEDSRATSSPPRPGPSVKLSGVRSVSPGIGAPSRAAALRPPGRGSAVPAPAAPAATAARGGKPRRVEVVATASVLTVRKIARAHQRVEERLSPPFKPVVRGPDGEPFVPPTASASRRQPSVPETHLRPHGRPMSLATPPRVPSDQPSPARATERTHPIPARPAEFDLQALTDQVVRQIDRRIVAHRERLGRM